MSRFQWTSVAFISVMSMILGCWYFLDEKLHWLIFVLPVMIYLVALSYGSFRIQSDFYTHGVHQLKGATKNVAITFDDGPHPEFTPEILNILKAHNVQAAFFCVGNRAELYPDIVKRIHQEGHVIGMHSYAHSHLYGFFTAGMVRRDLERCRSSLYRIINEKPTLYRPPFGVTNPAIAKAITSQIQMIGWSIRSLDTVLKSPEHIVRRIVARLHPGAIILLHDHLSHTPEVLTQLLDGLNVLDYDVVPLDLQERTEEP